MSTILLIEKEPNQRILYKMELEEEGFRVVLASNAWEGLREMARERPDLVVLDLGLPGMDGLDLLARMMGADPGVPVVINSAYEMHKDDLVTWSADAYVVKCSDTGPLKAEIRRVLSDRRGLNSHAGIA